MIKGYYALRKCFAVNNKKTPQENLETSYYYPRYHSNCVNYASFRLYQALCTNVAFTERFYLLLAAFFLSTQELQTFGLNLMTCTNRHFSKSSITEALSVIVFILNLVVLYHKKVVLSSVFIL